MDDLYQEINFKMDKAIEGLMNDFKSLAVDRANPNLLENLVIDVYGQKMPLKGVANVNTIDAKSLSVNVWDKNNVNAVDKAIRISSLNLNPKIDGNKLLIVFPPLTTERKKEILKVAKAKSENTKISIRNNRRLANDALKKMNKENEISQDQLEKKLKEFQNLTDKKIIKIDELLKNKENNLLEF